MKRIYLLILLLLCVVVATTAQDKVGFYLLPKTPQPLCPGQVVRISLHYAPISESDPLKSAVSGSSLAPYVLQWTVNGKKLDALSPADGTVTAASGFDLSAITYKAPSVAPSKNPVAIAVQVKTKDNSTLWLVANVQILEAQYKITMEAEQTLPLVGQDIKLHGECFANLKAAVDGSYFLEPVDKTRNMQMQVEKAVLVDKEDASQVLTAPLTYTIPFLFTIDKIDQTHPIGNGTMNLYYTSPQKGQVIWKIQGNGHTIIRTLDLDQGTLTYSPGTTVKMGVAGNNGQNALAMSSATELNLIAGIQRMDIGKIIDNTSRNIAGAQDRLDLAHRMLAHEKDQNYFKTKQGKADLQKLMALRQKIGGNITNTSSATKSMNAEIDDQYANNPDYIHSEKFKEDKFNAFASKGEDAFRFQGKAPLAQVTPKSALWRIEGPFNPKNARPFFEESKGASIGGGQQNATFKITVEKIK